MIIQSLEQLYGPLGISPLSQDDESLFRSYVKEHRPIDNKDFKDSWLYILQASRNFPLKIVNEQGLFILSAKSDGTALVIPNYFCSKSEDIAEIASQLSMRTKLPVILKNIDPTDIEELTQLGFDQYQDHEVWDPNSPYDDQTFSQCIVDIKQLLSLKGKPYRNVRRELTYVKSADVEMYDPEKDKEFITSLGRKLDKRIPGFYESHQGFISLESYSNLIALVFRINGERVGFTLSDTISPRCIAFNAVFYDNNFRFISSLLAYETAKHALSRGYQFFNFQGSETQSLDRWKRKFNPAYEIKKTHLIWRS